MGPLLKLLIALPIFFAADNMKAVVDECCGRCVGSSFCTACRNCSRCAHCNSGGSCGVCGGGGSRAYPEYRPRSSGSSPKQRISNYPTTTVRSRSYVTTASSLNVRQYPSTEAPIIAKLPYGTSVQVISVLGDWALIHFWSNKTGYVVKSFIGVSE